MRLGLRSYTIISVAIHGAVFGVAGFSSAFNFRSTRPTPATLTLRTNSKPKSASLKSPPKKQPSKAPTAEKITPKVVPVMRADAPEPQPTPEAPEPDTSSDSDSTETSNNTGDDSGSSGVSNGISLEREAQLLAESLIKPEYTSDALKARLQGLFAVDIHISSKGEVLEIELIQSPGYGMDERIIASLKAAKYYTKRNANGVEMETWITIQFKLEIP